MGRRGANRVREEGEAYNRVAGIGMKKSLDKGRHEVIQFIAKRYGKQDRSLEYNHNTQVAPHMVWRQWSITRMRYD